MNHEDQYLADLLDQMVQEAAEECPHPLSASSEEETPDIPSPPDAPPPPEEGHPSPDSLHSEEEVLELAWQVSRLRLDTQREIRQLVALLEEQTRKEADAAARSRQEGHRCRSYGFIAGTALVMAAMPLLTAAMTLSWKALGWFAQVLEVSPSALCAGLFCALLGLGTLKAAKPLGDRITEWLEDNEEEV